MRNGTMGSTDLLEGKRVARSARAAGARRGAPVSAGADRAGGHRGARAVPARACRGGQGLPARPPATDRDRREAAAAAEALRALAICLRHLACGYGLDPRERAAALTLLEAGIPDTATADLEAVGKILRAARRLGRRQRDRAAELSVRLALRAAQDPPSPLGLGSGARPKYSS